MFKIPYFLEGIANIFKPALTSKENLDDTKGAKNYRGKLTFDNEACIGCGICMRVCAGDAITKEMKPVEGGQEITMKFDLYSCTFCGMCKDFCPKKAIGLTDEVMMIERNKENLVIGGSFIKKIPPRKPPVAKPAPPKPTVEVKAEVTEKPTVVAKPAEVKTSEAVKAVVEPKSVDVKEESKESQK